nr:ankyrin repeat-containing protein At5g02620-like [Lolium perenne]XP_051228719.1 ankyrin repeat-containing protein At5g02620-like [Lolium perenne]
MFFAAMRNYTHVCEKLIETPSCAYSGGRHGRNCLHAAVKNGDEKIVKMVMEKCPVLARETDRDIRNPVRHAVLDGKVDVLRVMLEHDSTLGYEINSAGTSLLTDAAYRGQVAAARELLKHCPDAPYHNAKGETLLHTAVLHDQEDFIEFVLRMPILRKLVNVQDNKGKTALHYAVKKCIPTVVAALLSHEDVDATVLDNDGLSAAWELLYNMKKAKTLNWNEVIMLMSKANPQEADSLHNLHMEAKKLTTDESRKAAKSLTQTYTSNTSLVAILITTITFAAAFTLPGGYSSDAGSEGLPIMSKKFAFQTFLIFDVLAMCSSFAVAFICIIARWEDYEFLLYYTSFTKKLMSFAYLATTMAFSTGLYTVLASRLHWLAIAICVLVALLPIITWLLGKWPVLKLRFQLGKSVRSDFLDMV